MAVGQLSALGTCNFLSTLVLRSDNFQLSDFAGYTSQVLRFGLGLELRLVSLLVWGQYWGLG